MFCKKDCITDMRKYANAKINLSLDVKGKRPDGYHELDILFLEVPFCDVIDIGIADGPGISLSCSDPALAGEHNLAYRAASLLLDHFREERGVVISIEKHIPMQAGLGGGSSDAAAVLTGMNELFGFGASSDELRSLAVTLGADVPFFIDGGCARASGVGEKLIPVRNVPPLHLVIVKPRENISTAYAYENADRVEVCHPDIDGFLAALTAGDIQKAASLMGNSLEDAVAGRYPVIPLLKNELLRAGAAGALMTGSGSAVFGLFENKEAAARAAVQLQKMTNETSLLSSCVVQFSVAEAQDQIDADHDDVRDVEPGRIGQDAGIGEADEFSRDPADVSDQDNDLKADALSLRGPGADGFDDV